MKGNLSFEILAKSISGVNYRAGNAAKGAVNQLMTMRNWAIGYFIVEYEQSGKDRAEYGSDLLNNLERQINERGMNSTLFKWWFMGCWCGNCSWREACWKLAYWTSAR